MTQRRLKIEDLQSNDLNFREMTNEEVSSLSGGLILLPEGVEPEDYEPTYTPPCKSHPRIYENPDGSKGIKFEPICPVIL